MKTQTIRISIELHEKFRDFCKAEGLKIEAQAERAIENALDHMKDEKAQREARIKKANAGRLR